MQRLSIRRKSRRPKSPKWQEKDSRSAGSPEKNAHLGERVTTENGAAKGSGNHLSPESPDERKSQGSATSSGSTSSPGVSPSPSDGLLSSHTHAEIGNTSYSPGAANSSEAHVNGLIQTAHCAHPCETDAGRRVCKEKKENALNGSLSVPGPDDDPTIWQRRSALLLNMDDMIREGLMKARESDRRSSDPAERNAEGYRNSGAVASSEERCFEGIGIQARRNTSGNRVKRPMLTIEIAPSGSEPSLNQYVNVPEKPKMKQVTKLQPGEWDRYDSDENVYHHLDKVIGQPGGYQNVPGSEKNMSSTSLNNSYQNVAGRLPDAHSYENVAGARNEIHYINVEAKPNQSVNYIKVSGSGPPTPIQKNLNQSFSSRKGNPDYAEIDIVKTKRLQEMSREAKKEKVERVKKT